MLDEPLISEQVKKYIVVSNDIKEVLVDGYGIKNELIRDIDDSDNGEKIIEDYKAILN